MEPGPPSAARALERFLQDDCDFTPIHLSAKTALTTKPIVVLGLDQKSLQSLASVAQAHRLPLEAWLKKTIGVDDIQIERY